VEKPKNAPNINSKQEAKILRKPNRRDQKEEAPPKEESVKNGDGRHSWRIAKPPLKVRKGKKNLWGREIVGLRKKSAVDLREAAAIEKKSGAVCINNGGCERSLGEKPTHTA